MATTNVIPILRKRPPEQVPDSVTHIAAQDICIGEQRLRQRCAWCDKILLDYDFSNMATVGPWEPPATFPPGKLVRFLGGGSVMLVLDDADELPYDACARIDEPVRREGA